MNKHFTVAVLGAGARGFEYSKQFNNREEFSIISACDSNPAQLRKMKVAFNIADEQLFSDEEFF